MTQVKLIKQGEALQLQVLLTIKPENGQTIEQILRAGSKKFNDALEELKTNPKAIDIDYLEPIE